MHKQYISALVTQWNSAPSLIQWGGLLILLLILAYPLDWLYRVYDKTQQEIITLTTQIQRMQNSLGQNDQALIAQTERLKQSQIKLEQRFRQSPSASLAKIELQDELGRVFRQLKLSKPHLVIDTSNLKQAPLPHWLLKVSVRSQATFTQALSLVQILEEHSKLHNVISLKIRPKSFELKIEVVSLKTG